MPCGQPHPLRGEWLKSSADPKGFTVTEDEQIVRDLFATVDAGDMTRLVGMLTDDVRFQLCNAEPTIGRDALPVAYTALSETVASLSHEILSVWMVDEPEPATICELEVTYQRHDGSQITLPCLNVFRLRDGLIADYRIYMDINPVFANVA
jgi:ketosteroid isomerase-like protein